MSTVHKWIELLAVATAATLPAFASSAHTPRAPTRIVKAWDLDLSETADVHTLYERVRTAAIDVCDKEARNHLRRTRMRAPLGWEQRCVADAVESTVQAVGDSRLVSVHANRRASTDLLVNRR